MDSQSPDSFAIRIRQEVLAPFVKSRQGFQASVRNAEFVLERVRSLPSNTILRADSLAFAICIYKSYLKTLDFDEHYYRHLANEMVAELTKPVLERNKAWVRELLISRVLMDSWLEFFEFLLLRDLSDVFKHGPDTKLRSLQSYEFIDQEETKFLKKQLSQREQRIELNAREREELKEDAEIAAQQMATLRKVEQTINELKNQEEMLEKDKGETDEVEKTEGEREQ
ncbi:hypothetical protein BDV96DRAFT_693321 [Lophiotrema nucula]|uniref:Uncharacterized protein n=1 Tax=Lophiotrema nucula TaxID=690887 RepID=A0A6A5YLG2_9PLEO|nr:hypothetical protein BDV96DRAFT_693321 [Lophiotrema nucula]